jgi:CxxC motif-containing protein
VKVSRPVPKEKVLEVARLIHQLRVEAPVSVGQVLLRDLLGEPGVEVVATRSMPRLD